MMTDLVQQVVVLVEEGRVPPEPWAVLRVHVLVADHAQDVLWGRRHHTTVHKPDTTPRRDQGRGFSAKHSSPQQQ